MNEKVGGELSLKEKRKINKMKEKIVVINEEIEGYKGEEKKLNFKKEKLEKDRCLLVKKIEEKNLEMEGLSVSKSIYGKKIMENRRSIKKILAKLTFKTGDIEEENNMAKRAIKEADQKAEKLNHFLEKNKKKEKRIHHELEEIYLLVKEVNEKQSNLKEELAIFESSLEEYITN